MKVVRGHVGVEGCAGGREAGKNTQDESGLILNQNLYHSHIMYKDYLLDTP